MIVVQPSLTPDGTLGTAGGTVMDTQFQTTAEVTALDTLGNPITGTVDPLGLSATFIGISELSTGVALLPDWVRIVGR